MEVSRRFSGRDASRAEVGKKEASIQVSGWSVSAN